MSVTTETTAGAAAGSDAIVDLRGMWVGVAGLNIFYLIVRIYEQIYGWRAGLDSFAPEFQTYWLSILWTEIPLELVSGLALAGWLWKTRDRNVDAVAPREELRRHVVLVEWLVVYAVAIYWGASFFTEQDGTWHMTVIRDTDFTPSHIIEFYMSYPIYSIMAVGAFFYAKTRIPYFAHGFSLAFLIVAIGPFMIIPNVGLNEWGHTFWFMEELFVAPLHWGFVFFGWMALGVFGVVLQILMGVKRLIGKDCVAALVG
ncbi:MULTISPECIES: bacterial ammonia monooxygenase, subunit AmoC [Methylosinus]|uniref:Methane monooxygenase/ammonia monooxygenase subunit C n=2 Tax=Methylosinus trichosporium TaxID=426 RepID=A0A2D2CZP7_METT3|nr:MULTISPECIES: bacterial ammonia monooxygenase, subunit AmoC [Methylosinus]3CHX_C Chain C, PmoC [unidentified]3CHX_G Chain G, PmoC [unidentified]3CHX_K Chain K, PmoC [unidentified]AAF37893.1 PmoC [Methylosinus trichosporium OB3b]ATQ66668.1 methane monooxygenase/ammonia monooxygenase subunit C [Methylosinus trichosporium OB3b]ATQ68210.1 methane monooxygenase/ammonia monooxygenase subunit C [Methylosinus trichosporium OB3b]